MWASSKRTAAGHSGRCPQHAADRSMVHSLLLQHCPWQGVCMPLGIPLPAAALVGTALARHTLRCAASCAHADEDKRSLDGPLDGSSAAPCVCGCLSFPAPLIWACPGWKKLNCCWCQLRFASPCLLCRCACSPCLTSCCPFLLQCLPASIKHSMICRRHDKHHAPGVLAHVVQVVTAEDQGAVHLGGLDHACSQTQAPASLEACAATAIYGE